MDKDTKDVIIIGIDPGTQILGYSVICSQPKQMARVLEVGILRLEKYEDAHVKLKVIFEKMRSLIRSYRPHEMAIEAPFYGKNVQSMLKLGRAQGVAIACGMLHDMQVTEYSPKSVKQAISGNGNASKEQVAAMVQHILKLKEMPDDFNATDALGVALCHLLKRNSVFGAAKSGYSGWEAFVRNNPDKVK
ncbi:MAG: crossover junction endodeoxyribonuclease RuvC [Sphingobacteriales bacterium]|nr:crossover junction endodeoxyribonuclease RuvC [Sphingobacteriales bacterium]